MDGYRRAVDADGEHYFALLNTGNVLRKLGHFPESLAAYEMTVKVKPLSADAWYNKASVLLLMERPEAALGAFNKALDLNPDFPEAWYGKGVALKKLGRESEAMEAYGRARGLNPHMKHRGGESLEAMETLFGPSRKDEVIKGDTEI